MLLILIGNFFTILTYVFKKGMPPKTSIYPFKNCQNENNKMILIDADDTYVSFKHFTEIARKLQEERNTRNDSPIHLNLSANLKQQQKMRKYYISEH